MPFPYRRPRQTRNRFAVQVANPVLEQPVVITTATFAVGGLTLQFDAPMNQRRVSPPAGYRANGQSPVSVTWLTATSCQLAYSPVLVSPVAIDIGATAEFASVNGAPVGPKISVS